MVLLTALRFQKLRRYLFPFVLVALLAVSACSQTSGGETSVSPTANPTAQELEQRALPQLNGTATVVMVVKGAPITIEVNGNDAPLTAGNFVDLVQRGVYNGTVFHRVIRDPDPFVAQGGDPQSQDPEVPASRLGMGNFVDPDTQQPRYIPLEIKPEGSDDPIYSQTLVDALPVLKHRRGAVAMARSTAPDSASAQFYFALEDLVFLDGSYAVFGYVTDGMDVVDGIQQGDRIESATVTEGLENLQR
ncbi:MAG: peptidylprolyl isomerase [Cyanobacteria bacterium SID2]|nr:peptidylprolyl isomerase [Cyanobacteria bacterium SID2]MBP0003383.1 peptidylprolyl isomerase [Cyanobacteria bacterium SBC]